MTSPIRTERHDDVLVVISDNKPVNALSAAVRQGLEAAIKQGVVDETVAAIVIRCDGREALLLTGPHGDALLGWLDREAGA